MKRNAKVIAIILAIIVLATMCLALVACNDKEDKGGLSEADWETVVTAFKEATGGTDEFDVIISNFSSFNFSDGKFTAGRIDLTNGVTLLNIVVELDETGAIELISYEKRTTDASTPDRIITVDANGVSSEDIPKPTDSDKMDEDEWNEQVEVFANVTNYTLARTRNGENVGTMKLDGVKYYDSVDDDEAIIVPVDSKYYIYEKTKSQTTWTRSETTASRYQSRVNFPRTLVAVAAAAISGGFEQFSFNAGVYTLSELYLEDYDTTLRDIKVTVSGKAIVKAVCILVDGYYGDGDEVVTVDHVGSTVVTIPTNYDEFQTPPPVGPQKMSEDEWGNAIDNFITGTNFTTYNIGLCSLSITRRMENGLPQDITTLDTREMYFVYNGFEIIQIIGNIESPTGFCIFEIY